MWIVTRTGLFVLALLLYGLTACGLSSEEIDRRVDQRVREVLTAIPTPTVAPTPTLLPIVTPASTATPQPAPTPQKVDDFSLVYQNAWASVFFIESSMRAGSGWLIEPGLILTNNHVVSGNSTVTVRQIRDPSFIATVVAVDSARDIALLSFNREEAKLPDAARPLPFGQVSIRNIAQNLMALGYSGSGAKTDGTTGLPQANVGVLSQMTSLGSTENVRHLIMDVRIEQGDSGGPVLNGQGEVMGMIRAFGVSTLQGQRVVGASYAVHIDEIRAALPALKRGESR